MRVTTLGPKFRAYQLIGDPYLTAVDVCDEPLTLSQWLYKHSPYEPSDVSSEYAGWGDMVYRLACGEVYALRGL